MFNVSKLRLLSYFKSPICGLNIVFLCLKTACQMLQIRLLCVNKSFLLTYLLTYKYINLYRVGAEIFILGGL